MAARQTAWRAQKCVWQLGKPLGEPKNAYGSSANRLANPKMRMATRQTAWRAPKMRMATRQTAWRTQKQVWQNCPTSYGSREVASFAGIAEGYADESV